MPITIHVFGLCRYNPAQGAIGVVLRDPNGYVIAEISERIGPAINTVAEYQALIEGLKLAHRRRIPRMRVFLDSELVVEQVNGRPDVERIVQRDLDIAEYTDTGHDQMVPHTIVCGPRLVIHKIYNGYWFFGRPTIEELRHDLRALLQQCHWDWDLGSQEVRDAWARGERDRFYPPELGWECDERPSANARLTES